MVALIMANFEVKKKPMASFIEIIYRFSRF